MSVSEANEHREHAEHAAHENNPFITRVSITIALLAVVAAIVGSLETVENGAAIKDSSEAVLIQDEATDTWNQYQADSLKKHLYGIFADQGGPNAVRYKKVAADQVAVQKQLQSEATRMQAERKARIAESDAHEKRHHWLTAAATLLEIGIGLCSVSIITKRQPFWYAAIALGLTGLVLFAIAFLA